MSDMINPDHYKANGVYIEPIDVTEQLGFNGGNAIKYVVRCYSKGAPREDLLKALWYIDRGTSRRNLPEIGTYDDGVAVQALLRVFCLNSSNPILKRIDFSKPFWPTLRASIAKEIEEELS